ncbi:hypothetical protein BD779DRAFT_1567302 [Infundibulicybe gibba]|nr:hypothetical protein BD779DRAFT_1567302 [Infundibulicybe gibba]
MQRLQYAKYFEYSRVPRELSGIDAISCTTARVSADIAFYACIISGSGSAGADLPTCSLTLNVLQGRERGDTPQDAAPEVYGWWSLSALLDEMLLSHRAGAVSRGPRSTPTAGWGAWRGGYHGVLVRLTEWKGGMVDREFTGQFGKVSASR